MQGEVVKAAQPLAERFIYDARIERAETKPDVRQRPEQLLEQIGERQTISMPVSTISCTPAAPRRHASASTCSGGSERTRPRAYGMMQ